MITKLKNRYGDADINIGCTFHGEIGLFKELPRPDEISDYEKYLDLNNLREENNIKEVDEISTDEIIDTNTDIDNYQNNVFKF